MTTSPIFSIASSSLRRRLLAYYFSNPEQRLYLRELARLINADPGNLSKELKRLEKEGVFLSEKRGNQRHYSLNQDYNLYHELKSIVGKTIGVQGALTGFFRNIPGIQKAFIYGSFAKGEERPGSDVDICLIVKKPPFTEKPLLEGIKKLENELGREVSYVYFTEQEWKAKQRKNDSFVRGVQRGKRIELFDAGN
ncbi:MAG: nucleotidyltransferase domain-containing protein [Elusimicrobiota bacterium]